MRSVVVASVLVAVLVAGATIAWVQLSPRGRVYSLADVPDAPVALVFGAGLHPDGTPSLFLARRLEVARALYEQGSVRAILVSGDNSHVGYDEPSAMLTWLTEHGVPADHVVRDYAGFDTHDTCVRAHEVFGVDAAVLVTQDYHLPRALFSCTHAGIDAVGVGASSQSDDASNFVTYRLRELPASVRAARDVMVARRPTHLGAFEPALDEILGTSPAGTNGS